MPPVKSDTPLAVKTFRFHGMELSPSGNNQYRGECPFCQNDRFYVGVESHQWDCKPCQIGGNPVQFLRLLWEASKDFGDLEPLATMKRLETASLHAWGVVVSKVSGEYLIPGFNHQGEMVQLYRYVDLGGKWALYATPGDGLSHGLFGVQNWVHGVKKVRVCEGPWDGIALWEFLRRTRTCPAGYTETNDHADSLLSRCNVVAVPGAGSYHERWNPLFQDCEVDLLFDNDYPEKDEKTGHEKGLQGQRGMKRTAQKMCVGDKWPASVNYLKWGDGEGGYDPDLPDGHDVRDQFAGATFPEKLKGYKGLISRVKPIPEDWVLGSKDGKAQSNGKSEGLKPLPCTTWLECVGSWKIAMKWPEPGKGLDHALACMLATLTSTMAVGRSQLWIKVLAPPSTGKTTLAEGMAIDKKHVVARDTFTSLTSGYQTDKEGTENISFLEILKGRTFIVKDFDTIAQAENRSKLLSQLRALFDRTIRSQYSNKMSKNFEGYNCTVIVCGTNAVKEIDASEMGDRFLDVSAFDGVTRKDEDSILKMVADQEDSNMSFQANGKAESIYDPAKAQAMRLTGGYCQYLRDNAQQLLDQAKLSEEDKWACIRYGKFVSFLRARPSKKQDEVVEKEFAARLVQQFIRLAKSLSVVLNKPGVDREVLQRCRKVARDTSRGRTLAIIKALYGKGGEDLRTGLESTTVPKLTGESEEGERKFLRFLRRIGAVETFKPENEGISGPGIMSGRPRWRLTQTMIELYKEVMTDG